MEAAPVFPVGTVASSGDVVDREDFMTDVSNQLMTGQSVVLVGPRRIGKTSVAREIGRRLAAKGCYTAYVDLFMATSMETFATILSQAVLENRVGLANRAIETWPELKEWTQRLTLAGRLGGLDLELAQSASLPSPDDMVTRALSLPDQLAERDQRRFIIVIDEVQELEHLGGTPAFKRLRAVLQQQRYTTYLFLGSQSSVVSALFADRRQALYRFALLLDLPPVPAAAWRA